MRATDQRRAADDRILDDPYAKLFLSVVGRATLATLEKSGRLGKQAEHMYAGLTTYTLTRHRFIDDALERALADDDLAQVVLLGAGYDTRAYRFAEALKGRPIFEVDHPATSARKARIVQREGLRGDDVRVVTIDFTTEAIDERLVDAGFERGAKTFFVWEGVSMYLPREAIKSTFDTLRSLGGVGSELAMDYWFMLDTADFVSNWHRMSASLLHFVGEPIVFGIHPEDVGPFMDRHRWEVVDMAIAEELSSRYVRDGRAMYPANYLVHARAR